MKSRSTALTTLVFATVATQGVRAQDHDSALMFDASLSFAEPPPVSDGRPATSMPAECESRLTFDVSLGLLQDAPPDGAPPSDVTAGASVATDTAALAKAAQNPIANMISLPFQNNTYFGIGPDGEVANVLNIQPVYPVELSDEWIMITRTIIPVVYMPGFGDGLPENAPGGVSSEFGLGDINFTAFFSPTGTGTLTWGLGPSLTAPTASDDALGSGKWSLGPSFVVIESHDRWVYGALVRNIWSFAGDDDRASVNQFLLQPIINYNLDDGWYLTSVPIITANWNKDSSDRWTVPLGGGVGKIFKIGDQAFNAQVQVFGNVIAPDQAADWSLRLQLQMLFPK